MIAQLYSVNPQKVYILRITLNSTYLGIKTFIERHRSWRVCWTLVGRQNFSRAPASRLFLSSAFECTFLKTPQKNLTNGNATQKGPPIACRFCLGRGQDHMPLCLHLCELHQFCHSVSLSLWLIAVTENIKETHISTKVGSNKKQTTITACYTPVRPSSSSWSAADAQPHILADVYNYTLLLLVKLPVT